MAKQKKLLPNDRLTCFMILLTIDQVAILAACSESKIEKMISDDLDYGDSSFPKPTTLRGESLKPGRKRVWVLDEIIQWIVDNLKKERGELPPILVRRLEELGFL